MMMRYTKHFRTCRYAVEKCPHALVELLYSTQRPYNTEYCADLACQIMEKVMFGHSASAQVA